MQLNKGPFNNYVDKMRGVEGSKMSVQGIKTVHVLGGKKWQNSVHLFKTSFGFYIILTSSLGKTSSSVSREIFELKE